MALRAAAGGTPGMPLPALRFDVGPRLRMKRAGGFADAAIAHNAGLQRGNGERLDGAGDVRQERWCEDQHPNPGRQRCNRAAEALNHVLEDCHGPSPLPLTPRRAGWVQSTDRRGPCAGRRLGFGASQMCANLLPCLPSMDAAAGDATRRRAMKPIDVPLIPMRAIAVAPAETL